MCEFVCVCVQYCAVFDPVHIKTHIPKTRKGAFQLCASVLVELACVDSTVCACVCLWGLGAAYRS